MRKCAATPIANERFINEAVGEQLILYRNPIRFDLNQAGASVETIQAADSLYVCKRF